MHLGARPRRLREEPLGGEVDDVDPTVQGLRHPGAQEPAVGHQAEVERVEEAARLESRRPGA